ncbi:MAG TPA: hypothetical protein VJ952_03480, partial [Opitutales bacterium]|nr:hypothetical protein [Opitutales bacterium]
MKYLCLVLLPLLVHLQAEVVSYDFPDAFPVSERYQVTVDGHGIAPLQTARGAILNFGMEGPVRVRVQLDRAPEEVVIRPLSAGIEAELQGKAISFELPRPMNLSLEVDGDLDDPLLVFANPANLNPPPRDDPKVKYFEGGKIHQVGEIFLDDGET